MAGNRYSQYHLKSSFSSDNRFFQVTVKPRRPFNKMKNFYGEAMERLQEDSSNNSRLPYRIPDNEVSDSHMPTLSHMRSNANAVALVCSVFITVLLTFSLIYLS